MRVVEMELTRREFMVAAAATLLSQPTRASSAAVSIVLAPSNLGLSPVGNKQQGAWRAPQALMDAGLARALGTDEVISLERPRYQFDAQPGTRIRNGVSIRAFSLQMAEKVADIIRRGRFPVVVGGDCSVLLGGLYGSRIAGGRDSCTSMATTTSIIRGTTTRRGDSRDCRRDRSTRCGYTSTSMCSMRT
jgi:arginase family enzyme